MWIVFWLFVIIWSVAHYCAWLDRQYEAADAARREVDERERLARERAHELEMRAKYPLADWVLLPGEE